MRKAKNQIPYLSPAPLEAAENAEKKPLEFFPKILFLNFGVRVFCLLCELCGLYERKFYFVFLSCLLFSL